MLRPAKLEDAADIARVLRESFAEYDGIFDPPSGALSETEATVAEKIRTGCGFAYQAGRIVGCVFLKQEAEHFHLFRLAVIPSERGKGYAKELMCCAESHARNAKAKRIRLGTRLIEPNKVPFYESLGYEHVGDGTHPGKDRPTYAILVKELTG